VTMPCNGKAIGDLRHESGEAAGPRKASVLTSWLDRAFALATFTPHNRGYTPELECEPGILGDAHARMV
jgi:hypothetical protein